MKYVLTASEMKEYDKNTIERIGISSEVLMERAAFSVIDEIKKHRLNMKRILVIAGCGNNGGDGIAIGRMLLLEGYPVEICLMGNREKCSAETIHQIEILENFGFSIAGKMKDAEYDIIVDALFGIGLSREVSGEYREIIEEINRKKKAGAFVCSVDIASGICADTGRVMGCGVRADLTVTFAFAKRGQLLYPGKEYTGKLIIKDIGITDRAFYGKIPGAYYLEPEDIQKNLPDRAPDGNKGTFGKVLLIAGSEDMSGACLLCGKAVFRMGAGMVKIITPKCNKLLLQQMLPEAMLSVYEKEPEEEKVKQDLRWADVVVIGPGLSKDAAAFLLIKTVLSEANRPLVADADCLNLISENEDLNVLAQKRGNKGKEPMIFTPHPGELVRLCGVGMKEYKENRLFLLKQAKEKYGAIIAGKDAVTITVCPGKEDLIFNTSGTDGMATAGSGDVLAGVIAGLLAQGTDGFCAAALGVYLHGLAGEAAAGRFGRYAMMAGDIADTLGNVLKYREDTKKED